MMKIENISHEMQFLSKKLKNEDIARKNEFLGRIIEKWTYHKILGIAPPPRGVGGA